MKDSFPNFRDSAFTIYDEKIVYQHTNNAKNAGWAYVTAQLVTALFPVARTT